MTLIACLFASIGLNVVLFGYMISDIVRRRQSVPGGHVDDEPTILPAARYAAIAEGTGSDRDHVGWFLDERCVLEADQKIEVRFLYNQYINWCMISGGPSLSLRGFCQALGSFGVPWEKSSSGLWRVGIRLKTHEECYGSTPKSPLVATLPPRSEAG